MKVGILKKTILYKFMRYIYHYMAKKFNTKKAIKYQNAYANKIEKLKNDSKTRKLKIAFLTMYITDCQCLSLFEKMRDSSFFEPYFVINPDIYRSKENLIEVYTQCRDTLCNKYGKEYILDGYNISSNSCVDYTSDFDLAITNNPYDIMADPFYKSGYWAEKGIPLMYISYYYFGRDKDVAGNFIHSKFFNNLWMYFAENNDVYEWIKNESLLNGKNVFVTGYPKLDNLINYERNDLQRKKIIIAPHHTIGGIRVGNFSIGTFLDTADMIFNLPKKYPFIDFVFRPHPLLFENLRKDEFWGREKANKWLEDFCAFPNVEYSTEGDYFDLFINSSALIHDCGSFTAEYLCTQHPCAYLVKRNLDEDKTFTDFGKKCIHYHYLVKEQNDLYNFIDNVVINNDDYMEGERNDFARNVIMYNYPKATQSIVEFITKTFISMSN